MLRLLGLAAAVATLPLLAFSGPSALAANVHCGETITQDTTLDSDLDCSGPARVVVVEGDLVCQGSGCEGLDVVGPATLDLGGHTITGPGRGNCFLCLS